MARLARVLVFSLIVAAGRGHTQGDLPRFEDADCPFFIQEMASDYLSPIACGYLLVPEDRSAPVSSRALELFVARLPARAPQGNAPILYLEGGPGGAASQAIQVLAGSSLNQNYEVIVIDQRGTGLSRPSLNCHEADDETLASQAAWLGACYRRLLAEGAALHAYNSAENARDLQDLLTALDLSEVNVYGISYGTRLALTLARDHPQRLRSMILDGVYPPQVNALETQPSYANRAFERLFSDCASDPNCRRAFPTLRDSFLAVIQRLDEQPAEIEGRLMSGADFVNEIFNMLYDSDSLRYVPALIDAFSRGDYDYDPMAEAADIAGAGQADEVESLIMQLMDATDSRALHDLLEASDDQDPQALLAEAEYILAHQPFQEYLGLPSLADVERHLQTLDDSEYAQLELHALGVYDEDSEGVYYSIECADEIAFSSPQEIERLSAHLPTAIRIPLVREALETFSACDIWALPPSDPAENEALVSATPTLLLSGEYDPITPPDWGRRAAEHLANSWHFVFPKIGHGALWEDSCADAIALAFLADPTGEPDSGCLADLAAPEFYIPEFLAK